METDYDFVDVFHGGYLSVGPNSPIHRSVVFGSFVSLDSYSQRLSIGGPNGAAIGDQSARNQNISLGTIGTNWRYWNYCQ
jgi:hypothetical protein